MLEVRSPYDYSLIKEFELDSIGDVQRKISLADETFKDQEKRFNKVKRVAVLEKAASLLEGKKNEFTKTIALEGGKPLKDALVEVLRAIDGIKHVISELRNFSGREIPMGLSSSSLNKKAFTVREPKGLVVAVSAFNHPLNLIIHQVVPAVAVGCPVIIKPDLRTPISCVKFVELLYQAGLDKTWCQVSLCKDHVAEEIVKDKRNTFLSFVGSESVGWHLRSVLPKGAGCTLEHGGVAPVIVDETADIKKTIPALVKGGFYHSGQVCVSVQRVFIHKIIKDKFLNLFIEEIKKLKVGDPLKEDTDLGPLIEPSQVDRILNWVKESGGEILIGGNKISEKEFSPTLLLNPDLEAKVSNQEIFGPVVCVYVYENIDEAIKKANGVDFAFQASIFSNNHKNIMKATKELQANAVMVNDHTAFRVDWMPFGGYKSSGLGVGGFKSSFKDLTNEKLIVFNEC